jgi:hypothetical protein
MSLEENLLNKSRELSFNLLEIPSCFKLTTCSYTPSDHIELSASINAIPSMFGIDIEAAMLSHISGEFTSALVNKILRKIDNTQSIEFIDRRGIGDISLVPCSVTRDIVSEIINHSEGYDNIVCNGAVACILQDDSRFHVTTFTNQILKSGYMHHVGVISGIKVWVDPFMRYNDNKILAFNIVGVDVNNFSSKIVSEATLSPRLTMGFNNDIFYDDVKKIYLITDSSGPAWLAFTQYNRNSKINDILDEEE